MSQIQYDVGYTEKRNRLTSVFRNILAIPHLIFVAVWGYAAEFAGLLQWFIILFTGKRNQGIYNFQLQWLGYASRVQGYTVLLFDEYPKFGNDASGVPSRFEHHFEEDKPNRLSNALRLIWAIPALFIGLGVGIAGFVLLVIQWFAILFTGKAGLSRWTFIRRWVHFGLQLNAYIMLMTDVYPNWAATATTGGAAPSGPGAAPAAPAAAPLAPGSALPPPPPGS